MPNIIKESLERGYDYRAYREVITALLEQGKSTGKEQSDDLTHYSQLNETRMNRLDKTIKISSEYAQKLELLQSGYVWLVISEGWCGDAAQTIPILNKMAEHAGNVVLRIVLRDENPELMNLFLTNGSKSIPKLIILNKINLKVLGDYGPRPIEATKLMIDYKKKHGVIDEMAKTNLQLWYFHDKGLSIQKEVMDLMDRIDVTVAQSW